jgi:hypothetical protein
VIKKMSEDMLAILNQSLELVGKRELGAEELKKFVQETLRHDVKEITLRTAMFNNKELENEREVNNFPFYGDGYRSGIFIQLKDDNIFTLRDDDGNDIQVKQLFKKDKNGDYVLDNNGEMTPTGRCYMRLKARTGFMSVFIGLSKAEALDENKYYVLVGGISTQWKVANTDEDTYHKKKETGLEYTDFPSYTLNVWQIGEIKKVKGGKVKILLPDCNWKQEEAEAKT